MSNKTDDGKLAPFIVKRTGYRRSVCGAGLSMFIFVLTETPLRQNGISLSN